MLVNIKETIRDKLSQNEYCSKSCLTIICPAVSLHTTKPTAAAHSNPPPPSLCRSGKLGEWQSKVGWRRSTISWIQHNSPCTPITQQCCVTRPHDGWPGGTLLQVQAELRNSPNLHKLHLRFQHSLHGVHSEHLMLVNSVLVYQLQVVSQQEHDLK